LRARGDKVMAMMEGVVVKVGQDKTSGKYVTLRHGRYTVSYCHLSKILIVKGAIVHPRDVVGITGSTGRSTGEHLHITCKLNGRSISPSLIFDYIQSIRQECISALAGL
jgi:murein DD-endopeptidase MepM/ murein hydrolase activator NlpD